MKKTHILLFTPSLHTGGGTERVLCDLANLLCTEGYTVTILTNKKGEKVLYELNSRIQTWTFRFASIRDNWAGNLLMKICNKLFGKLALTLFLKKHITPETNSIICFSPDITNDCFKTKFRELVIAFEHLPYEAYNKFKKAQDEIKTNFPRLKKVIVLTDSQKQVYDKMGCNTIKIPNTYSFYPEQPAALENKIVLSVGHLNKIKRRDLLLKAWRYVNQQHPDWELHIIGEGPEKEAITNYINEHGLGKSVRLISPTKNIESHYKNASIFALTSEFESFSLVLLEAKVSGLPCVSFDVVCGPSELIHNGTDGYLIPFADTKLMSEKINLLIENKDLRQHFGAKARTDAVARFSPELIKTQWLTLLQNT